MCRTVGRVGFTRVVIKDPELFCHIRAALFLSKFLEAELDME